MDTLFGVFITGVVAIGVLGILAFCCVYAIDGLFRISDRELEKRSKEDEKNLKKRIIQETNIILNDNTEKIVSAYRNLVTEDAFGEKNYKKFKNELINFILKKSKFKEELDESGMFYQFGETQFDSVIEVIETFLEKEAEEMEYDSDMSPYDYEDFCANEFNKNGWRANSTKGTSDQGIDVIAKRKNKTLVAQCKKYSKPVGNKAVQEVVAGISFYKADVGIVIATNGYTKSAKSLASANNIKLIHHSEIKAL